MDAMGMYSGMVAFSKCMSLLIFNLLTKKGLEVLGRAIFSKWPKIFVDMITLEETNISHLGKRKIISKSALGGDMLVHKRVIIGCD